MSDTDDDAARLEAALDRIAAAAQRSPIQDASQDASSALPKEEIAQRLDALIARIRIALGPTDEAADEGQDE